MRKENVSFRSWRSKVKWYFDSTFSEKSTSQLAWLAGIISIVFILIWGFSFLFSERMFENSHPSMSRPIRIISLLINPGAISEVNPTMRVFAILVVIIGIIVLSGFLITVFSNMLSRHVEQFKNGDLHYDLHNHIIIIGFNDFTISLIKQQLVDAPNEMILLVSTASPAFIRETLEAELDSEERLRIVFYSIPYTLQKSIDLLNCNVCKRIFILGDKTSSNDDSSKMKCLECIVHCNKSNNPEKAIQCYIFINSQALISLLKISGLKSEWEKYFDIIPVNFEESWARKILIDRYFIVNGEKVSYPTIPLFEIANNPDKQIHWVISGMTDMGKTIGEMIARLIHLPDYNNSVRKIVISFVDDRADEKMESFISTHSAFFELQGYRYIDTCLRKVAPIMIEEKGDFLDISFEFVKGNLMKSQTLSYLSLINTDGLFFAICDDDDDVCFQISTNLPENIYEAECPIFVRQKSSLNVMMARDVHNNIPWNMPVDEVLKSKFSNLYPFGMREDVQFLTKNDYIYMASTIFKHMGGFPEKVIEIPRTVDSEFGGQRQFGRPPMVNIYFDYLYEGYLTMLIFESLEKTEGDFHSKVNEDIDKIKRQFHIGLCVNRLLSGFRYKKETKNLWFASSTICPYKELPKFSLDYLKEIVKFTPETVDFIRRNTV